MVQGSTAKYLLPVCSIGRAGAVTVKDSTITRRVTKVKVQKLVEKNICLENLKKVIEQLSNKIAQKVQDEQKVLSKNL
jgi:hypothetical protein